MLVNFQQGIAMRRVVAVLLSASTLPGMHAVAQAPRILSPRTQIDTLLARQAVHQYMFRLRAGQSAAITVTQRGVDVVLEVRNARDSLLRTVDSPNGRDGPEEVEIIAPRTAEYRLVVRPFDEREPAGHYALAVTAWRSASGTRAALAARERARAEAAAWLESRSVPLPRLDDVPARGTLAPLDSLASRTQVIGIGEATHGSREFGDLRLMLTRYLVEYHGFRIVAIEASASRLAVLDGYTRGRGSAESITAVVESGWIGRRALRELVGWLREWNQDHPHDTVRLVGLDVQDNAVARRDLRELITRGYPQALETYTAVERELSAADSQSSVFGDSQVDTSARRFLREFVAQATNDAPVERRLMDSAIVSAGLDAARGLLQFAEFNAAEADMWSRSRDWDMAANLLGALERASAGKAVVWAHNAHVAAPPGRTQSSQPMGSVLRSALGCRYGALAVTFGQGAFVAEIPNDLEDDLATDTLPAAPVESVEGVMGLLHNRSGTLTTWPCEAGAAALPAWLREPQQMHWLGALFKPGTDPSLAFRAVRLVSDHDGIVFIPVVTGDEMPTDRPLIPARRR